MNLTDYPRTATEARALDLKFFYSGVRCKHGHDALRYSNGAEGCVQCNVTRARERDQRRRDVRDAAPVVRPLVLLGTDWSPRVVDGSWADVQRLALKEQNSRESA